MAAVNDVTIIGGGIGGLTLAVALRRVGIAVRIIEKGNRASRLGTGICLLGNAMRALDRIGLADRCIAQGYGYDKVKTCDAAGNVLQEIPSPRYFRADRPSAFGIMRPVLADILESTATDLGAVIAFETTVASMAQREDGVSLVLSSGEKIETDLVVGADGAYSPTRTMLFGDAFKPEYCGQGGIRFTAPRPEGMDGVTFYRTPDGRGVGAIPLSEDTCYYFILESGERHGHLGHDEVVAIWKERVGGFTAPELVSSVRDADGNDLISYRPFDVLMMPAPWHRGRVVLIGDAVHSMSPQLTSGGGMAIEDAVVLAEELSGEDVIEDILVRFEQRREARVRPVLETSLGICRNEQNPTPVSHEASMALLRRGYELLTHDF